MEFTMSHYFIISFILAGALSGCVEQKEQKVEKDKEKMTVAVASEEEITTPSGLKYVERQIGTGDVAQKGKTIAVHYVGTLEDGTKFDSSVDRGKPIDFKLGVGQVIKGWDEGLTDVKVGGKRKLIIPAELGYGNRAAGKIPANSTLIFEVELVAVK
jgi:peptidylprolyl isomerase